MESIYESGLKTVNILKVNCLIRHTIIILHKEINFKQENTLKHINKQQTIKNKIYLHIINT
jgi:hypothetical protein